MKVKALLPYFGGKRTMAPDIVRQLGKHTQYFEPFCGSAAVLFAKQPSQKETINDLHGDMINLARVVQRRETAEDLYERLERSLFSEDLLVQARDWLKNVAVSDLMTEADVERAYWYFLASWMGRNGTAGTERQDYQIAVRWTKNGGSPTVRWFNAVESLPAWHQRLRNVVIMNRDAFDIIPKFEDVVGTAIYVDPPYPEETRSKISQGGMNGRYLHEFEHGAKHRYQAGLFGDQCAVCQQTEAEHTDDHRRLAEILRSFRHARIVVSSYECPRVRELYDGWTFFDCARQKHLHCQNGRGQRAKDAPEVLIVNGTGL